MANQSSGERQEWRVANRLASHNHLGSPRQRPPLRPIRAPAWRRSLPGRLYHDARDWSQMVRMMDRALRERETGICTRPSSTGTHVRTSPRTETTRLFDLCFVSVPVDDKESPLSSSATHSGLNTTWDHSQQGGPLGGPEMSPPSHSHSSLLFLKHELLDPTTTP